jgi:hypothetical protein
MKQRLFAGIPFLAAGLLIAFGPLTLFPVCKSMGDMVMVCHWLSRAELGSGLVIAILGLLTVLVKLSAFRLGVSLAVILNAIAALLYPTILIGVCGGHDMMCRLLTRPSLIVISVLIIIIATVNAGFLAKKLKAGQAA